ncbi:MAG: hypothetical protein WAL63_03815 [Solirubrobacteraceae bacterium]
MTTTVAPDLRHDDPDGQAWPILAPHLAETPPDDRTDWFDPTQGRTVGVDPYNDPTRAR